MTNLRAVFTALQPTPITLEEAEAIVAIAQLVVDIDGREGPDEIAKFFEIGKLLFESAGQPDAEIPTFATDEGDEERMFDLASQLKSAATRELAYAVARVLAAVDLDVAPEEETFLERTRGVLSISNARAGELAAMLLRP